MILLPRHSVYVPKVPIYHRIDFKTGKFYTVLEKRLTNLHFFFRKMAKYDLDFFFEKKAKGAKICKKNKIKKKIKGAKKFQ